MKTNAEPGVGEHQGHDNKKHLVQEAEDAILEEGLLGLPAYHRGNEGRTKCSLYEEGLIVILERLFVRT